MSKVFNFLKNDFTKLYMKNVLEHKAVNKAIAFCNNDDLNFIYTGMFSEVNNGKGITEDLELYLVTYLTEKHDVKGSQELLHMFLRIKQHSLASISKP